MCIKNLYSQVDDSQIPNFLKEKINKSTELTGDAFFLKVFASSEAASKVYYEQSDNLFEEIKKSFKRMRI